MQITSFVLAAVLGLAAAAPAPASDADMMATGKWSLQKFTRTCNKDGKQCKFSFTISTGSGKGTPCDYTVSGKNVADENYGKVKCGAYTISSGWSDYFGKGNGFTVLAVTDQKHIIYPSYNDKQLASGKAVSPDQCYTPQSLPK